MLPNEPNAQHRQLVPGLPPLPPGYTYPIPSGCLVYSYYNLQHGVSAPLGGYQGANATNASSSRSAGGWWYTAPLGGFKDRPDNKDGRWEVGLCESIGEQPLWFCGAAVCGPCAAYKQRKILLMVDDTNPQNWERYVCFAGMCGPTCCEDTVRENEECCMMLESCCCPFLAMHGNRYMVQVHYHLEDTCCDTAIIHLSLICWVLAVCCDNDALHLAADIAYMAAMGCMAAQHAEQIAVIGYPKGLNITKPRVSPQVVPQQVMQ